MWTLDFEMKYEPGRNEADPLDFLSRQPLPIIGNKSTEKILKASIETKHAIVLDGITGETRRDTALQKLSATIKKGNWETSKKDVDLAPFYPIKNGLYEAQGLIFRMEKELFYQQNYNRKSSKQDRTPWCNEDETSAQGQILD